MLKNYMMLLTLTLFCIIGCGGDSTDTTGPTPITTGQVKFQFMVRKTAWYNCGIAVGGDHSRTVKFFINGKHVGSVIGSEPHSDRSWKTIVEPGQYNYAVQAENYKHERLRWSGTVLANYPFGALISVDCR